MKPQEEMRQIFFESATELVQKLNDEALQLETNPLDRDAAREIRRIVHTIKGDSAVLGFGQMSELAHELEDVLSPDPAPGDGVHGAGLASLVLSAADMFDAMLAAYQGGVEPPNGDPLRSMIWKFGQQPAPPSAGAAAMQPKFAWNDNECTALADAVAQRLAVFNIAFRFAADCPMRTAGAELIDKALQACGDVIACAPPRSKWGEAECIEAALATQLDEESISSKLFVPGITANLVVQRWTRRESGDMSREDEASLKPPASSLQPQAPRLTTDSLLRVEVSKVDALLNLVGELVIGKSIFQQAVTEFGRRFPKDPLAAQLADAFAFQSQTLRALQRAAMGIRMVPVEQLFRGFPRLVHDVARQCGKQVALETNGRETELDKALVDALAEPLGHIVRNAIAHGIETPEERRAAGKPESGRLRLNAFHQGNQMVIEVVDDGRGIDRDLIVRRAVERGLITKDQASSLDTQEIVDFIFEPGFSTAGEVTAISGRGVGMDVVKAAVQKLKGSVTVESAPGSGSTVRMKLPLTLAIMRSMLFRVGESLYALPLDTVVEIRRASEREFTRTASREVLQVRDELVTVVRMQRMHCAEHSDKGQVATRNDIRSAPCPSPLAPQGKNFAVILNAGQRKFALLADAVVGEQELVIKPLDEKTIAGALVSGASVLGDGTVALVLNAEEVVRRYAFAMPVPPAAPESWNSSNSEHRTQH